MTRTTETRPAMGRYVERQVLTGLDLGLDYEDSLAFALISYRSRLLSAQNVSPTSTEKGGN